MKNKVVLAVVVLAVAFMWIRSASGGVGLEDGSFLVYQQGTTTVRLTFHAASGGKYRTAGEITYEGESPETVEGMTGHGETVDARMRTESGSYFELASFGPLWVQPPNLKEGGSAYGSRVAELRQWRGREVAVVTAALGMGAALRGEWHYDVATGFLVGGMMGTAASDSGLSFELVAADVPGLVLP